MRHSTAVRSVVAAAPARRPGGARPVVRVLRARGCPQPTTAPRGPQLSYGPFE
ncbi:hypothetical protein ACRAWF_23445 [Streptomyces sp. L7]